MDPLGKKGEVAFEGVQNVSNRVESLESRIEALDQAFQSFADKNSHFLEKEQSLDRIEVESIEDIYSELFRTQDQVVELKEELDVLTKRQRETSNKVEEIYNSGFLDTIERITGTLKNVNRAAKDLRNDVEEIQKRVDELENNLMLEENKRDYDFDQKLDKKEFDSEKTEMMEEIKHLRASINVLADELDKKDEIEVE